MQICKMSDFYPHTAPLLPGSVAGGVPDPLLIQTTRRCIREFCESTGVWREWLPSIDLVEDQAEYVLAPTYCAEVNGIVEVRINTENGVTNGDDGQQIDRSDYTFDPELSQLVLGDAVTPVEDVDEALDVHVMLLPELNEDDIAEWLFNRYFDGLQAYIVYKMGIMPNQPWSLDPGTLRHYLAEYRNNARAKAGNDLASDFRADSATISA